MHYISYINSPECLDILRYHLLKMKLVCCNPNFEQLSSSTFNELLLHNPKSHQTSIKLLQISGMNSSWFLWDITHSNKYHLWLFKLWIVTNLTLWVIVYQSKFMLDLSQILLQISYINSPIYIIDLLRYLNCSKFQIYILSTFWIFW